MKSLRNSLAWCLIAILILGGLAAIYADYFRLRWTQFGCESLIRTGQSDEAIRQLRSILSLDMENKATLRLLVRAYRRNGQLSSALQALSSLEKLGESEQLLEQQEQLILIQSGSLDGPQSTLASLVLQGGDLAADALFSFVLGKFANLRTDEATQLLEKWQEFSPNDPQVYFLKGYLARGLGNFTTAIGHYRRGLRLAPGNDLMRVRLADCFIENSEFAEAREQLLQIPPQSTQYNQALIGLAKCHYSEQEWLQALKLLDRALEASEELNEGRLLRGRAHLELGNLESAKEDVAAVLLREPNNLQARDAMGKCLRALGNLAESKMHLEHASQVMQAQTEITRLIRQTLKQPDDVNLRFQIGTLAMKYTSSADGAKWMRTVLEIDPNHRGALELLKQFHQQNGDVGMANHYHQRLQALNTYPSTTPAFGDGKPMEQSPQMPE